MDILPPNSPEIEKDVISVLSHRPDLLVTVEEFIGPECFYDADYQYLFGVMFDLHMAGEAITQSSILHRIVPSGRKDILQVYQKSRQYYSDETALFHNVQVLVELSKKRTVLTNSHKILNMIQNGVSLDKIETVVNESMDLLQTANRGVRGEMFTESLDELEALMDKPASSGLSGITTGVKLLNNITGGWQMDDTVLIAARPGMGKTILAAFHAHKAAASGVPVAFITLEVSKAKITGRIMSDICGFPSSDITKGRLAHNQKQYVRQVRHTIERLPIYYYDSENSWDINDICKTMRNWKRKYKIGLIVIDYVQLVEDRTVRESSDSTKVLNSVVPKLTRLKTQIQTPLIVLSQLTRETESTGTKRPSLKNLAGSRKLEEQATVVIFPYRQDYYDANDARERGQEFVPTYDMEYIFAKNREGELGPALVKCNPALNRVYEDTPTNTIMSFEQASGFSKNSALDGAQSSFF